MDDLLRENWLRQTENRFGGQFDEKGLQGSKHSLARVPILLSAGQSPCSKILSISDMDDVSVRGQ